MTGLVFVVGLVLVLIGSIFVSNWLSAEMLILLGGLSLVALSLLKWLGIIGVVG